MTEHNCKYKQVVERINLYLDSQDSHGYNLGQEHTVKKLKSILEEVEEQ